MCQGVVWAVVGGSEWEDSLECCFDMSLLVWYSVLLEAGVLTARWLNPTYQDIFLASLLVYPKRGDLPAARPGMQ